MNFFRQHRAPLIGCGLLAAGLIFKSDVAWVVGVAVLAIEACTGISIDETPPKPRQNVEG